MILQKKIDNFRLIHIYNEKDRLARIRPWPYSYAQGLCDDFPNSDNPLLEFRDSDWTYLAD